MNKNAMNFTNMKFPLRCFIGCLPHKFHESLFPRMTNYPIIKLFVNNGKISMDTEDIIDCTKNLKLLSKSYRYFFHLWIFRYKLWKVSHESFLFNFRYFSEITKCSIRPIIIPIFQNKPRMSLFLLSPFSDVHR